jgi:glycosyltransferase involved in cell wall biosynthesis
MRNIAVRRIAYIVKYFPLLTQTFVVGELCELRRRGVEILIGSLRKPTEELRHDLIARNGLDQLTIYDSEDFAASLAKFQPQILHAHFATDAAGAARSLASEFGVPFTFTAHGYDIYFRPPPDFEERAAAAAAIVTVSEANQRQITRRFGVPRVHIHVIPNGVDTSFFCPAENSLENSEDTAAKSPLIVCVARHTPVKNLELLLQACAILRDRAIEFRCALIGDGPSRSELEALRARLRLDHLVQMIGEIVYTGVREWWQRATVAVLSSDSEGMPINLIEAAACGVPAVATRVGGIPELIEHGVTGLLTSPGDASALASALAQMLKNPRRAAEIGRAARDRAVEKFSLTLQVDRLIAMWQGVLEKSSPARFNKSGLAG